MLATYFPKPLNQLMGNWALLQAQALSRNGVHVTVVSPTSWVPRPFALTKGARAYAECPEWHPWNGLQTFYPRWLFYQVGPASKLNEGHPEIGLKVGWRTVRSALRELVRSIRPEVIYAHHTAVNGYLAMQLKRCANLPFLVTDHDFGEIESCRDYPARRRLFHEVTRESATMIAVSKRMEAEMKDQFPAARTCTVPNGADPLPQSALETPRSGDLQNRQIIFSCGTFYHRKGFPLLVDAFARIAQKHSNAELRIAGDGEERGEVESRIAHHGLGSRVTLLGALSHAKVIQEMVWCDAFALVGWDEPFATVYLEALSAGKPVVCCRDGGIADVVKDGEHGFTVPPRDIAAAAEALDHLLGNEELRKDLGRAALSLFETSLTWDRHARRMIELFENAVREKPVPVQ